MLGTRYEEYLTFKDNLPFKFYSDITITPTTYSKEANWHENIEIQFCTEGSGYVLMDMKTYNISKNQIAVVNSNVIHHTNTTDRIKYDCLIIDTAFCSQININTSFLNFKPLIKSDLLLNLHKEFKSVYEDINNTYRIAKLYRLIIEILIELIENQTISDNKNDANLKSFKAVKTAIKYIRKNYHTKMSLNEISKASLIDKFTLSRDFKKITNQTVVQYINSYRCQKAANLISAGSTVSESAKLCGFTNMSFFTKTFKHYMGCMPNSYKKSNK